MMSSNSTDDARAIQLITCPNYCNLKNFAGFPAGVKFNPSDQEIIEHLESMVLVKEGGGSRAHPLINHFIPTIEGENGICYTHPENLPGVTRDGFSKHFFHRTSKAYPTSTRKRRKILSEHGKHKNEDVGEAHYWHVTGKTYPVIVGGRQKGYKKFLVLYNIKQGKREKSNWVMHEYHLGTSDEEKVGELVLSKVVYRCPGATKLEEQNNENVEVTSETTPNTVPVSDASVVTAVHKQQHQLERQAHGHSQCKFAPDKMFQEAGVGNQVSSGDQVKVHVNNHPIPSEHYVQSVHMEPDTTLSLAVGTGWSIGRDSFYSLRM